jgi:Cu/Ag efflux pump CusA
MEAEMKLFVVFTVIVLLTGCLAGEDRVEIQSQPDLHKVSILVDGNLFGVSPMTIPTTNRFSLPTVRSMATTSGVDLQRSGLCTGK